METTETPKEGIMATTTYDGYIYTEVDIDKADGNMDDYVVMEKGDPETALVLLGWDEVGLFDHEFTNPVYARMTEVIRETNPLIIGLVTQLIVSGYSDEQILAVLTDKTRPLTIERLAAFRAGVAR